MPKAAVPTTATMGRLAPTRTGGGVTTADRPKPTRATRRKRHHHEPGSENMRTLNSIIRAAIHGIKYIAATTIAAILGTNVSVCS